MRMNNVAIVAMACALNGIDEPVFTYAEWRKQGRIVRRGEHARVSCTIYKPVTKRDENGKRVHTGGFFPKLAHFFTLSQTDVI